MKARGEDISSAVREWFKSEVANGSTLRHDLGKFFFGASTGALGLFITLFKFATETPVFETLAVICFGCILISIVVSIYMAIPIVFRHQADTDLYDKYNDTARSTLLLILVWLALWVTGFIVGTIKLFN